MKSTFHRRLSLSMGLLVASTVFVMATLVVWNAVSNIRDHYDRMVVSYSQLATRYIRDTANFHEEEMRRATERIALSKVSLQQTLQTSGAIPPGQSWDAFSALLDRSLEDLRASLLPPFSLQRSLEDVFARLEVTRAAVLDADGRLVAGVGLPFSKGEMRLPNEVVSLARSQFAGPAKLPATARFGPDIGVATRLELPGRPALVLYLQHRTEPGRTLIRNTVAYVAFFAFVMIAGSLVVTARLSRQFSKPIDALARGMRELGGGNLDFRLELETQDEIQEVAEAVGDMADDLRTARDELEQETLRRERLEHELHIAAELQLALLPDAPPQMEGLELLGWSRPAREVGGDFYDFIELGPQRIAVAIGDATGKGLPAALLVTECWSVLRTLAEELPSPATLLYRTNNALSRRVRSTGRFVTLFFMVVDAERGTLTYASAGQNPPLLVGKDGKRLRLTADEGFPLGIVSGARFSEHEVVFGMEDTLLLYSDGLTEAQNVQGDLYGESKLAACMARLADRPLLDMLAGIKQDMDDHVRDAEIFDDVTMVGLRFGISA